MAKVVSRDGTCIEYERVGAGPPIVLVASALADRSDAKRLAGALAEGFAVINYDRRGRGASGDKAPYAVEREVEDIAALIDQVGAPAFIFGSSSGAVLALEATARLPGRIRGQALFEPPFIVDGSRRPVAEDLVDRIGRLLAEDRRADAIKLFFTEGMGIPALFASLFRLMPGWSAMKRMAHTIPYDLALLEGTQAGKPLPRRGWAAAVQPTLVVTGGRSEPFFSAAAKALVDVLPNARHAVLAGQSHGAIMTGARELAGLLAGFCGGAR